MNQTFEQPTFVFFRSFPENLMTLPPLCSSLQNIESCFYFISLDRYPHALISCASALESAMKSILKKSTDDRISATYLYNEAIKEFPNLESFDIEKLKKFRETRNRFSHYGFSPKDDEESAVLILKTGIPFLIKCYKEFFDFDLLDGLIVEISEHLKFALESYEIINHNKSSNMKYCFSSFAHLIRWAGLKYDAMSILESKVSEIGQIDNMKFEIWLSLKEKLENALSPSWTFNCPVCNEPDSFVCELNDVDLNHKIVSLKRGICANCDLNIPNDASILINMLFKYGKETEKNEILSEYGII
jgi:hypothetical protein